MKKLIIGVVAGLFSCATFAQENHEITVYGGGGLSALKYNSDIGDQKNHFGGLFGIGYKYFFTRQWGVGSGAELSIYNSKITFDQFADRYMARDIDGSNFEFRSTISNYEEKQNAMYLNIPVMLNFQTTGRNRFYAAAGGKIGIPVNGKYKTSGATIRNSGYYTEENFEYTTQEFMGFGTFTNKDMDEDLDFKVAYMLSVEAGMKWKLNRRLSLYTGAYFDYGLNDIRKDEITNRFVAYHTANPRDFKTNSVLFSSGGNNQELSDKVMPMAAGIKVGLAFSLGGKKKVEPISVTVVDNSEEEARRKLEEEAEIARRKAEQEAEMKRIAEQNERERQKQQQEAEMMQAIAIIEQPVSAYELNQTSLSPHKKEEIDRKIELLKKYPDLIAVCEGHTCDLGSSQFNKDIGMKRAEAVKNYMVANGIAESRISLDSKGEVEPIVPNTNEENRRQNRRVKVIVSKK